MKPWITVIGIGDDGLDGINAAARALIDGAELLVGGDRHQAMVAETEAERLTWAMGLRETMDEMAKWKGRRVVVLATGDPMYYGAGANLTRRFDPSELFVIPYPGAFALARARMLWSAADVELVTVHGRPLETLNLYIAPWIRLVTLSQDGATPAQVARLLTERGFGTSPMSVFEHMGGPKENRVDGVAETWGDRRTADLNTIAVECIPGAHARVLPRVPGLPDDLYEHDGQITKREVRAVTVSALAPRAGAVLWDIGAGSGSVGIEWLRACPTLKAVEKGHAEARCFAFEHDADRAAALARNAAAMGVPRLQVVSSAAPAAFGDIDNRPDVIFVGGGVSAPGVLQACWDVLLPGGTFVANGVTLQAEQALMAFRETHAGDFVRIVIEREKSIGSLSRMEPMAPVLQYRGVKT